MKIRTFCFFAAFGATIFACSGSTNGVGDEGTDNASADLVSLCGKDECGPGLEAPTLICPDGSVGGNTGRCIKSKASPKCHWEMRDCPPPPPACDCGPMPMSVVKCWDGSTSSPVCLPIDPTTPPPCAGADKADPAGKPTPGPGPSKCGWVFKGCPPPPPPKCDCGPAPMNPGCNECVELAPGKCAWEATKCPPPVDCSAPGACGPALGMPNYVCPDGKTIAGPGKCIDQGGKCGWEIISCPTPVCDPAGAPPKDGCKWDSTKCVWLCL